MNWVKKITAPHHLRQQLGGIFFAALIGFARRGGVSPLEEGWLIPAGFLLYLIGLAGRVWASGFLVKNDRLTTSGPYGRVRNPIYVANLLIGAGLILLSGRWLWGAAGLVTLYVVCYVPGMRVEEENLRRRYGTDLEAYAKAVPLIVPRWKCVPGYGGDLWRWDAYRENREGFVTMGLILGPIILIWIRLSPIRLSP